MTQKKWIAYFFTCFTHNKRPAKNNVLLFKWNFTGVSVQLSPFHFFSIWNSILAVTNFRSVVEAGTLAWGSFCNQKVFGKWWEKCGLLPLTKVNRTNSVAWRNYFIYQINNQQDVCFDFFPQHFTYHTVGNLAHIMWKIFCNNLITN